MWKDGSLPSGSAPPDLLQAQPPGSEDLLEGLSLALQGLAALRKPGDPSLVHLPPQAETSSLPSQGLFLPATEPAGHSSSRGFDDLPSSKAGGREQVGKRAWVSSLEPLASLTHYAFVFPVAMALQAVAQTIQRTQLLRSSWPHIFPLRAARKSLPEHASVRTPSQGAVQVRWHPCD